MAEPNVIESESSEIIHNKGYDYNFVDTDIPQEYYCLICTFVSCQPHQVTCCGQIYCKGCLRELRIKSQLFICLKCGESLCKNYFKDINTERKISQLQIYCTNKDSGCHNRGELKDLDSHLTQCLYQLVKCPNQCDVPSIQRQLLQHHLEEDCPNREVSCPHCNITDKHNIVTGSHLEECPDLLIPCPNEGCQEHFKRRVMLDHRDKCPLEIIRCKYSTVGCRKTLIRQELPQHNNDNIEYHLELAMTSVVELSGDIEQMNSRIEDLQQEITELKVKPITAQKGPLVFKLNDFSILKSRDKVWCSPRFYTSPGGYNLCLSVYSNGEKDGKGTHISCYIHLMPGEYDDTLEWPFKGEVTVELLNQEQNKYHKKHYLKFNESTPAKYRVVEGQSGLGWGKHEFLSHSELSLNSSLNCQYLKDDTLYFRVSVTVTSKTKPWLTTM